MKFRIRPVRQIALALVAGAAALPAGAATVKMIDASYTVGPGAGPQISTLAFSGAGTLTISLTDIPWPQSLASIAFQLDDSQGRATGVMDSFGQETIAISGPTTLFALSDGTPRPLPNLPFGYGSYGLEVDFTPATVEPPTVPLPQTALLLASGLVMVVMTRRRERFAIKV